MSARSVTLWYGVCDRCGAEDDDSQPTEAEARERMWQSNDFTQELCWECCEAEPEASRMTPDETRPDVQGDAKLAGNSPDRDALARRLVSRSYLIADDQTRADVVEAAQALSPEWCGDCQTWHPVGYYKGKP